LLKKSSYLLRIYYEDTDLAGIVYYANYLKFIERARSEMLKESSVDQIDLFKRGYFFVVVSLKADYLKPAYFEDSLEVITEVEKINGASIILKQTVLRSEQELFEASIRLALLDKSGKAVRLPANIRQLLRS
jgi:acyl-CoA thioester hydrolase